MNNTVHEIKTLEFIEKKSIYNQLTSFLETWKPKPPSDYTGYLKEFLETINKNKSKLESMNDSFVPIFLLTLSICLMIIGIIICIVRKSPVYITIIAASLILIFINVIIEVKKRGEVENVSQCIKVEAEILKTKTKGQFEIIIIKPMPKGCYIFSAHNYVIKLILKYQTINENKNINMYSENDPFALNMNNFQMIQNPNVPTQNDKYDIPMQEIQLYEGKGIKTQETPQENNPYSTQNNNNNNELNTFK